MNPAKGKGIPMWALRIDPHQQLIENGQSRALQIEKRQTSARRQAFDAEVEAAGRPTAPQSDRSQETEQAAVRPCAA
jgi:hypothetical protein